MKAKPREHWITRECPAIVGSELWEQANATLHRNQIAAIRSIRRIITCCVRLIRCSVCGLTVLRGDCGKTQRQAVESYYRCNGKQQARGIFGKEGKRCPSPGVRGPELEAGVWAEIVSILYRGPARLSVNWKRKWRKAAGKVVRRVADEMREMESALTRYVETRNNLVSLVTDGVITREDFQETGTAHRRTGGQESKGA